jgi:pseudaminic acid biosynthesis-associated methylase
MSTTEQLKKWSGEFGERYTDRNEVDWRERVPGFREIFSGLTPGRVLEIGCNRGHNLVALADLFPSANVVGIEPNPYAISKARQASPKVGVLQASAFDLPFKDGWADLAFTCGVLIHIALPDLRAAMAEIHRVSCRWIMCSEYFATEETTIPYRGHDDLLWKRDFGQHWLDWFPDLRLVRSGYLEEWDRSNWWVFEKKNVPPSVSSFVSRGNP